MEQVIFTNSRGESITFSRFAPFKLVSRVFSDGVHSKVVTQRSPYQDGVTYVDGQIQERGMQLEFLIVAENKNHMAQLRRKISSIFNPKLGMGELECHVSDGIKRKVDCVIEIAPSFPKEKETRTTRVQPCLVSLFCPSPYWVDTYTTSRQMSYVMGGYKFSLRLPVSFSKRSFQRGVVNEGDVETPVKIEFKGPAQNPTVYNRTTGEFIRVKRDLSENDILHIDTTFGKKRVEIVRASGRVENAFHYIDLASSFFQLVPGPNTLEYNSNNDSSKTRVTVMYKNRYVGV
ncbi:phage tail family protein [Paenibacillus larvae]